jgi:hypothetical protein
MRHAVPPEGISVDVVLAQFRRALQELPARHGRRLMLLLDRLEHWVRLRDAAARTAEGAINDLQLENACLRFDLDVTRRELEDTGSK